MVAEGNVDLIVHDTFFRNQNTGVLVEVGAARPDYLSISGSYRLRGWRIIAIEPNPNFCAAHRALGYELLQYACSDENADDVLFFIADSHGRPYLDGLVSYESYSSLGIKGQYAQLLAEEQQKRNITVTTIPVQVRRLETILTQHAPDVVDVDVLTIDVEGWELSVMRGVDLAKHRPKVVILENLFNNASYPSFMRDIGYVFWRHIYPNDVYVRADMISLIPTNTHTREHAVTSELPRIAADYYWWHSIDLGNGIVTPGHKTVAIETAEAAAFFDRVDLRNRSVLDIGAWNGFYSFEAKRRGAARVLATDSVCWTDNKIRGREGFELARQALKVDVEALEIDVSDISPETTGCFDAVLFLGVFYHRYDPIEALACAASVAKQLLIVESHIDLNTLDRPAMVFYPGNELLNDPTNWWGPNLLLFEALLFGHGFSEVEIAFHPHTEKRAVIHAWRSTEMRRNPIPEQKKWKREFGITKSKWDSWPFS